MTNVELLNEKINDSGKKKGFLAQKLGVSRATFKSLCVGKSQFKTEQVKILCDELNIVNPQEKESIFFA